MIESRLRYLRVASVAVVLQVLISCQPDSSAIESNGTGHTNNGSFAYATLGGQIVVALFMPFDYFDYRASSIGHIDNLVLAGSYGDGKSGQPEIRYTVARMNDG